MAKDNLGGCHLADVRHRAAAAAAAPTRRTHRRNPPAAAAAAGGKDDGQAAAAATKAEARGGRPEGSRHGHRTPPAATFHNVTSPSSATTTAPSPSVLASLPPKTFLWISSFLTVLVVGIALVPILIVAVVGHYDDIHSSNNSNSNGLNRYIGSDRLLSNPRNEQHRATNNPLFWRPRDSALALVYPPGLLGGYRNQFIRFTSFVAYAAKNDLTHLFLPSLLWSTTILAPPPPGPAADNDNSNNDNSSSSGAASPKDAQQYTLTIPMEFIFDIDAWNRYALAQSSTERRLPVIVQEISDSDCWVRWNQTQYYQSLQREQHQQQASRHGSGMDLSSLHPLQRASLERGTIDALSNVTQPLMMEQNREDRTFNARRMDVLDVGQRHCRHPRVYGGGIMAGRLWNDYTNKYMSKDGQRRNYPYDIDQHVLKALRPLPKWRRAAQQYCFGGGPHPAWNEPSAAGGGDNNNKSTTANGQRRRDPPPKSSSSPPPPPKPKPKRRFLALHARVELEMLAHPCGRDMERNLTKIFQSVQWMLDYLNDENKKQQQQRHQGNDGSDGSVAGDDVNTIIDTIFVAVWRQGIDDPKFMKKWGMWADNNLRTLNRYTTGDTNNSIHATGGTSKAAATTSRAPPSNTRKPPELLGGRYHVVECGSTMMGRYYADNPTEIDHGTLLEQAINFDLAVEAEYFVGVHGSSYSTDVWTTRYYLGKGTKNFQYTTEGIQPVENNGLPSAHGNCKRKKQK